MADYMQKAYQKEESIPAVPTRPVQIDRTRRPTPAQQWMPLGVAVIALALSMMVNIILVGRFVNTQRSIEGVALRIEDATIKLEKKQFNPQLDETTRQFIEGAFKAASNLDSKMAEIKMNMNFQADKLKVLEQKIDDLQVAPWAKKRKR